MDESTALNLPTSTARNDGVGELAESLGVRPLVAREILRARAEGYVDRLHLLIYRDSLIGSSEERLDAEWRGGGLVPLFTPLSTQEQQAINSVMDELKNRYRDTCPF